MPAHSIDRRFQYSFPEATLVGPPVIARFKKFREKPYQGMPKGLEVWQLLNPPLVFCALSQCVAVRQAESLNCLVECELLYGLADELLRLFFSCCGERLMLSTP